MLKIMRWVRIKPDSLSVNGCPKDVEGQGAKLLVSAYKKYADDYPKFFKMDTLCRLGFVASELLLAGIRKSLAGTENCAVSLFNVHGSFCNDCHYESTISDKADYYPSPSVFVYTLPNIVTGEICIRNKLYGESSFYVLEKLDWQTIAETVRETFQDEQTTSALCGWTEVKSDDDYDALLMWVKETNETDCMDFKEENIKNLE